MKTIRDMEDAELEGLETFLVRKINSMKGEEKDILDNLVEGNRDAILLEKIQLEKLHRFICKKKA